MGQHPGFVAVTLIEPDLPLDGMRCGGKGCNRPATLLLMVIGEVEGSDEPTFYPTCRGCAERMYRNVSGHNIGRV